MLCFLLYKYLVNTAVMNALWQRGGTRFCMWWHSWGSTSSCGGHCYSSHHLSSEAGSAVGERVYQIFQGRFMCGFSSLLYSVRNALLLRHVFLQTFLEVHVSSLFSQWFFQKSLLRDVTLLSKIYRNRLQDHAIWILAFSHRAFVHRKICEMHQILT